MNQSTITGGRNAMMVEGKGWKGRDVVWLRFGKASCIRGKLVSTVA